MKTRYLFIFLLLLISFNSYSDGVEPLVIDNLDNVYNLNRSWNFSIEDKEFNKMDNINFDTWFFASTSTPWIFTVPEASKHYSTAWYQIPLVITKKLEKHDLAIYLPLSYGSYTLYLNNTVIFEGSNNFGYRPHVIKIDKSLLNPRDNSLLIKAETFSAVGGFGGFMEIGNYKKIKTNWIVYVIRNASISFVSLFLAIYFIIMYLFRRKERYNLYFAGFSLSIFLFTTGFYGLVYYIFETAWAYWVITFIGGINMYLFPILFIHSFYNMKLKIGGKLFAVFYSFLTLFVLIEYIITGEIFNFSVYLYTGFTLSYMLVVIYLSYISIRAVRKGYDYSKTMLIGLILLSLTFIYSMLCFSGLLLKPPIIAEGFFLMVLTFSVVLAKRFAETHSELEKEYALNVELSNSLEIKVEERTKELAVKNKEIIESIEYAALIQDSILPSEGQMEEIFSDFYIHWKPKDIVGGDFYWVLEKENGFIAAIVDCTGHGVPGALLTMTAKSLLERIVTHMDSDDPGLIITHLNKLLKKVLSQDNPYDIKDDGLEIGMCIYNNVEKTMTFAGSRMRMHTRCNDTITEYRGDKQGVGYKRSRYSYTYNTKSVALAPGMTFHLTTDGFPEQSGGDSGYSLGWKKYTDTLLEMDDNSMKTQQEKLKKALDNFQGEYSQRDDITLFGFKLKD